MLLRNICIKNCVLGNLSAGSFLAIFIFGFIIVVFFYSWKKSGRTFRWWSEFWPNRRRKSRYSVAQSLMNSLSGDVVLDGFNMVYRDEDNILDQTYEKQICLDFFMMNFIFHNIIRKFALTLWVALKPNFMSS